MRKGPTNPGVSFLARSGTIAKCFVDIHTRLPAINGDVSSLAPLAAPTVQQSHAVRGEDF